MQNPRRPPAERRRTSGARDRPVSWTRRMEEAREARARVLAAREGQEGDDPEPAARSEPPSRDEASPPSEREYTEARSGFAWRAVPWWVSGGFLVGASAGAVAVWILLSGEEAPPPRDGSSTAPAVASAPPDAVPERAAEAAPPTPESAPEATAADDGGAGAGEAAEPTSLPEFTAADRARGALRQTGDGTDGAGAAPPAGTEAAEVPAPEDAAGTITDAASLSEVETAPSQSIAPVAREDEAIEEPEAPTSVQETDRGDGAAGEVQDAQAVDTASADADEPDAAIAGAGNDADAAPADEDTEAEPAEAAPPEPPTAEGSPQVAETVAEGAAEEPAAAEDTAAGGVGRLYVHAAPEVTSEELADVVSQLSGAGFTVEATRRVDFRISQTNVRYFHEEDAEVSAGVAEAISGVSRDFTDYEPSPDPGTIEVWLEG